MSCNWHDWTRQGWGGGGERVSQRKAEGNGGVKRHHFSFWQSDLESLFNPTGPHRAACFYTLIKTIIHDPSSVFLLAHMNYHHRPPPPLPKHTKTHSITFQLISFKPGQLLLLSVFKLRYIVYILYHICFTSPITSIYNNVSWNNWSKKA